MSRKRKHDDYVDRGPSVWASVRAALVKNHKNESESKGKVVVIVERLNEVKGAPAFKRVFSIDPKTKSLVFTEFGSQLKKEHEFNGVFDLEAVTAGAQLAPEDPEAPDWIMDLHGRLGKSLMTTRAAWKSTAEWSDNQYRVTEHRPDGSTHIEVFGVTASATVVTGDLEILPGAETTIVLSRPAAAGAGASEFKSMQVASGRNATVMHVSGSAVIIDDDDSSDGEVTMTDGGAAATHIHIHSGKDTECKATGVHQVVTGEGARAFAVTGNAKLVLSRSRKH